MTISRHEARATLWKRGNLRFKLHDGQVKVSEALRQSSEQLFVANISRQFGKSYWAVTLAIETAIKTPRARIKYGTAFQTDLLEFILPTFNEVLKDCPPDVAPKYKTQGSKWVFNNGAEIKLIGLDKNPNAIRGNVLDLIIIDEAGFVTKLDYLYHSIIIPATTHRPNCKIVMISTPPVSPSHPFRDFIKKAELTSSYVKATIYSNPLINPESIERLKKESGGEEATTWRREYMGELITDENMAIIPNWRDRYCEIVERPKYWQYSHKYVSMDLGVGHHTAVLYAYYDFPKAKLIVEDEFIMSGVTMTTLKLKDAIVSKEREVFGDYKPYLRISDSNNPLLLQDLSLDHGVHFIPTDKGTLEEMINHVKILVDQGRILVHPRCVQLTGCLKYGIWNPRRTQFAEDKLYGHFDALAALIYLVRNLDKLTNPIPQTFMVNLGDSFIFHKEPEHHRKLKKAFST